MDTLDIFEGGKRQTVDYHGMFNHTYFVTWMNKLFDALEKINIKNALIIMDNAKYYKMLPQDTPTTGTKKHIMIDKCQEYGIEGNSNDLRNVIWNRLREYIKHLIHSIIVNMAEKHGHEVLFTPLQLAANRNNMGYRKRSCWSTVRCYDDS